VGASVLPEFRLSGSTLLRAFVAGTYRKDRTDSPDSIYDETSRSAVDNEAGIGLVSTDAGGVLWTYGLQVIGSVYDKSVYGYASPYTYKYSSQNVLARIGLEKKLEGRSLIVRGSADLLEYSYYRGRYSSGQYDRNSSLIGPVRSYNVGLGFPIGEGLVVDVALGSVRAYTAGDTHRPGYDQRGSSFFFRGSATARF